MAEYVEDWQMDFNWADLEDRIIAYSKFLIENDYTVSDDFENIEASDDRNIEMNSTALEQPKEDVLTAHTQVFYIHLSDFLAENEELLGTEAV